MWEWVLDNIVLIIPMHRRWLRLVIGGVCRRWCASRLEGGDYLSNVARMRASGYYEPDANPTWMGFRLARCAHAYRWSSQESFAQSLPSIASITSVMRGLEMSAPESSNETHFKATECPHRKNAPPSHNGLPHITRSPSIHKVTRLWKRTGGWSDRSPSIQVRFISPAAP